MLGSNIPLWITADPIPVPNVSSTTTPVLSLPAPNLSSASPAASASLRTVICWPSSSELMMSRALVPIHDFVDVGRGADDAVGDDAGVGDPERAGPPEFVDDGGDRLGDRRRRGGLRCQQLEPVADQLAGVQVDDAALDPAATDVDAETRRCGCRRCAGRRVGGRVGTGHRISSARRAASRPHPSGWRTAWESRLPAFRGCFAARPLPCVGVPAAPVMRWSGEHA